jgi:L-threonylcarbamoyladenylate synthase
MPAPLTTDVHQAGQALRRGQLVAFATETVYGLGANALDVAAVARVFEAKGRPRFDPLIVHIADAASLPQLVTDVPPLAQRLIDQFWPGPLTLVLPKQPRVPDLVTAGLPTVAVRMPDHPQARQLIELAGCPVAAPSANLFGRISPTTAAHVQDQLGDRIDLILDGGPCRVGVESTIVCVDAGGVTLLRPGGITVEELEQVAGQAVLRKGQIESSCETLTPGPSPGGRGENGLEGAVVAPGMLPEHYAPLSPLVLVARWEDVSGSPDAAALGFRSVSWPERFGRVEVLSPTGDLREAAAGFFAALRRLDALRPSRIYAERFPPHGLGLALNDRLERAAGRRKSEE